MSIDETMEDTRFMISYGQMTFNKSAKTTEWGKGQSSQPMVLGELDIHVQKNWSWALT